MIRIKEGFKNQRLISLSDAMLADYAHDPMIGSLYLRKIGYFPRVKYHYVQKPHGVDYSMLIYCTEGEGWCDIAGQRYGITANQFIILPPNTPLSFGASENDPWTIYWLHFRGSNARFFVDRAPCPTTVVPDDNSRIQHRLDIFEELYATFSMAYTKDFMIYSSMLLGTLLSSFVLLPQYCHISIIHHSDDSFANRVIHFMNENVQHQLSLDELAKHFNYSVSHFSMLFHVATGVSPITYFIRLKIQKACQYIELTNMRLSDIAHVLGFEDAAYFTRTFIKVMGMTPSDYRDQECWQ